MVHDRSCLSLGGTRVDVWTREDVLATVLDRLREPSGPPLLLASANLDHISHFGPRGCSKDLVDFEEPSVQWLVLLDGVPLVWRSRRLLGAPVDQLAGSDLLPEILDIGAEARARVGFFGGAVHTHERLRQVLADNSPQLVVAECWSPAREELNSPTRCRELAAKVAAADVDLLVVALGKPRQEQFLAQYGHLTGVRVAVAFGAAVDFLAGHVQRAPLHVRQAGLEWLWRLAQEPRRLARRYLVAGPPGALALLRDSRVLQQQVASEDLFPTAALPRQRSASAVWDGLDRRGVQRRRDDGASADPHDGIPRQRRVERRSGTDRRSLVPARSSSGA